MSLAQEPMPFERAVELFRRGSLTPRDYLEAMIETSGLAEDAIQAFACTDLAEARRMADAATARYAQKAALSPIDGIPVAVKDIIHTAALPTCMGSAIYKDWQPRANAPAVDALIEAGAVILGKTHTTEFAIGVPTVTKNPRDTQRTPGGSSSGTAAAVAAGMVCAGLGTQTQGSIIRPASYCGVVGYKPTWGVLPLDGVHPVSRSHDHLGVIASSLDTAWAVAHSIGSWMPPGAGEVYTPHNASLETGQASVGKIAFLQTAGYQELSDQERSAFEKHIEQLADLGISVIRSREVADLAAFCAQLDTVPDASVEMVARDMIWPYAHYSATQGPALSAKIHALVQRGRGVTQQRYMQLRSLRAALRRELEVLSHQYDGFLLPSASGVAPLGYDNTGSRTLGVYASFLGVPAVNLPTLNVDGLPLGIQLIGAPMDDYALLCKARVLVDALEP